jgi:DNA-binding MarR family transcriptional regulator
MMDNRDRVNQIYEAVNTIEKIYEKWSKSQGIGYYDMQLYYSLVENDGKPMTQKQICDEMDVPKTTINSIVKNQLKLGYIRLDVNPSNRKEKLISLTPQGKKYAEKLIYPLFEIEESSVELLNEEDIELMTKLLYKYANSLIEKMNI